MSPRLFPVEVPAIRGRLAITLRPRGHEHLDADVAAWRVAGIDLVASCLERHEEVSLGLEREHDACRAAGIEFLAAPVRDRSVHDSIEAMLPNVELLADRFLAGRSLALHCWASLGRSPTLAACTLVRVGVPAADAIDRLSIARETVVPETQAQHDWVYDFERLIGPRR